MITRVVIAAVVDVVLVVVPYSSVKVVPFLFTNLYIVSYRKLCNRACRTT